MQHHDTKIPMGIVEMHCLPDYEDAAEQVVMIKLLVPVAAKVPAPRQYLGIAMLVVRQASVTSTVPAKAPAPLRANNTAHGAAWCSTATLASQRPGPAASRF